MDPISEVNMKGAATCFAWNRVAVHVEAWRGPRDRSPRETADGFPCLERNRFSSADSPTASLIIVLWGFSKVVLYRHRTEGEHLSRSASSHKSRVCDLELISVPQRRATYLHVTLRPSIGLYNDVGPNLEIPMQENPCEIVCNSDFYMPLCIY